MREGFNPNKNNKVTNDEGFFHQVVIPVYIPHHEEYFKDSFKILKYTLNSLFKTCHLKTFFTIVNNGCSENVSDYLDELLENNKIQELIHTINIGKFNAILKGVSGQGFPLVTIVDADVLFLNDWQKETYKVFEEFKEVGVVSTTPSSKMIKYLTSNIVFANFFNKNLKFTKVKNPKAMKDFAISIGNSHFYKESHLNKYLTLKRNNIKVVVGAGHFVATYRREVFEGFLQQTHSKFKMGSELRNFLDKPVVENGFWRVSTADNYTYHMGNVYENWMSDLFKDLIDNSKNYIKIPSICERSKPSYLRRATMVIFDKLINVKLFWQWFIKNRGLNKLESKEY